MPVMPLVLAAAIAGSNGWIGFLLCGAGAVLFFTAYRRLKRVVLEHDHLIVSDYWHVETIPLSQVKEVNRIWRWRNERIEVRLNRPSRWGYVFLFMPPLRFIAVGDPVVLENLREQVRAAAVS
jgi:hypothetical protein